MENGTFSSDLLAAFRALARQAHRRFGVTIHLLHIVGKRHAYVEGDTQGLPALPPHILPLSARWAVAVYGWETLSQEERADLARLAETLPVERA